MVAALGFIASMLGSVAAALLFLGIVMRDSRVWLATGKHISKPLCHRFGWWTMWKLYLGIALSVLILGWTGPGIAHAILSIYFSLWVLDDYFFGDRPRKKRLREWAKAKLRAMKPVMQRAAQRWKPTRNPIPIPV